jgi:hypothetical protein
MSVAWTVPLEQSIFSKWRDAKGGFQDRNNIYFDFSSLEVVAFTHAIISSRCSVKPDPPSTLEDPRRF